MKSDNSDKKKIEYYKLPIMDYVQALNLQQKIHAQVANGTRLPTILFTEHPQTITFGLNSRREFLVVSENELTATGITLVNTDRGGEVTAHLPGQLMIYPILNLTKFNLTPKKYISLLLETVISVLAKFGVTGCQETSHPGVWVGGKKICAIGLRVKNRTSYHGLALNINNDLDLFGKIIPCGLSGRGTTTLKMLVSRDTPLTQIIDEYIFQLSKKLCEVEFWFAGERIITDI